MRTIAAIVAVCICSIAASAQAALITLNNADFSGGADVEGDPLGWTTIDEELGTVDGAIYVSAQKLRFQGRPNNTYTWQAITTAEATADSYGSYDLGFLSGWMNNSDPLNNDITLRFSIWNQTDDAELGFAEYTFPVSFGSYSVGPDRDIGNQALTITYNNTAAGLVGDEIALRITNISGQDYWDPTGYIDDITLSSIPEPSSFALAALGLVGLAGRRRRRRSR